MQDFRKLAVWQKAHALTLEAYAISDRLARSRHFVLRDQVLRAALSVPANIAEGAGRTGDREFRRFLRVALGSASELEYHLILARDLRLLTSQEYEGLAQRVVEVKRMLAGLAARLGTGGEQRAHRTRGIADS